MTKCNQCGAEMRSEHSFVFGTDFHFCPNRCGQIPNRITEFEKNVLENRTGKKLNKIAKGKLREPNAENYFQDNWN